MPRFEAFAALRYAPGEPLDEVTAPPYDVLSTTDVEALRRRHPHNITAVDVPLEGEGPDRYSHTAARLAGWLASGAMQRDATPSLTLYRVRFVDAAGRSRTTVGVIGALEVVDEGADGVLPHERTTPKASTDRLDLTRATRCNVSPIWGLSLTAGLSALLTEPGDVVGTCVDADGVVHQVERIDDAVRIDAISAAVGANTVLIADGHHRYAVSRQYRDEIRAATGRRDTDAELTMTYVAELVEEQLSIDPIHRLYRGMSVDALADRLGTFFDLADAGRVGATTVAEAIERGALCLVRPDGTGTWLTPRARPFSGMRQLDGAFLEHALTGVTNLEVEYQHGVQHVLDRLAAGDVEAAVLVRPTSIDEIRRTATEHLLMPPKSTFFTPKLRTGLVVRPLALD